jgi:CRISPR-associated exonuclease Cas4
MASPTPSYPENALLPLSALQHLLFCERQCALIHLEQVWAENPYTLEGRDLHERVDSLGGESRGEVHIARGLALRSLRLGLSGRADVVELHRAGEPGTGASVPGLEGRWVPFPVEYKRGRPKHGPADTVQLAAQALCLEEMLGTEVPEGALFYGKTRRRLEVTFDAELRRLTEETSRRLHRLIAAGVTPRARREPKCERCSLLAVCRPGAGRRSAADYLEEVIHSS